MDSKEILEKIIMNGEVIVEGLEKMAGDGELKKVGAKLQELIDKLKAIQKKVYFKTKDSILYLTSALDALNDVKDEFENLDGASEDKEDIMSLLQEYLDAFEGEVNILTNKATGRDIVIT